MTIAKNYLFESEISELNRIVVMWLDFAEDQAQRRKDIFLKDWEEKLNAFLTFNDRKVLPNAGSLSKKQAGIFMPKQNMQSLQTSAGQCWKQRARSRI